MLITKPSLAGFGMNWQHCADTGFVGLNDSFEQFYQAVRRFWRFGQQKPVTAHIIASELEGAMHMADLSSEAVRGSVRDTPNYTPSVPVTIPAFLERAA